jgi:hypothetical protein
MLLFGLPSNLGCRSALRRWVELLEIVVLAKGFGPVRSHGGALRYCGKVGARLDSGIDGRVMGDVAYLRLPVLSGDDRQCARQRSG